MKIGYRTLKTSIGTPISIFLAQLLGLSNFVSAGILTILCIKPTRKRSLISAWHRVAACLLVIGFAWVFFETIGYHPVAVGLLLLLFIPTAVQLNVTEGIVTSSVILLHLYESNNITPGLVFNEVILIIVGIGTALVLNLYMPSLEDQLKEKQQELETNFKKILKEVAYFLKTGDLSWTGKEITEAARLLEEAKSLASRDLENHLLRSHHPYYHYFQMRGKQFEILERMLPLISRISTANEQSQRMGEFFEKLSESVHPGNTAVIFLQEINEMKQEFRKQPLPETRDEFEIRANLLTLLNEIEQYLIIKRSFKKSDISYQAGT